MSDHADRWIIEQDWRGYTPQEHRIWNVLFRRQSKVVTGRACGAFTRGLDALNLGTGGIPDINALNEQLSRLTGWQVVPVAGLVPDIAFFDLLADRRFPAGRFIRRAEQLDYLQEPDIFHDLFGHVPMLTEPVFADYMQAYGEGGLRAARSSHLRHLARLYWHTVEFGLVDTPSGLRFYGAGIASSKTEALFALEDEHPDRIVFSLERVMRTPYRIDSLQPTYFVTPSLEHLLDVTLRDFGLVYDRLSGADDIEIGTRLADDLLVRSESRF